MSTENRDMEDLSQWPAPKSREVGLFTDLTLYAEALALAQTSGSVTISSLQRGLGQRLQRMRLVLEQSVRTVERLVRELRYFRWLQPQREDGAKLNDAYHVVTPDGLEALRLSRSDPRVFRRLLTAKMQETYIIPGWFVARLWQINPDGQGEVILPAPAVEWRPTSARWDDHAWNETLRHETLIAAQHAHNTCANAFPIEINTWLTSVQQAWSRLSALKPRGGHKPREGYRYSPRTRLALAMREAAVVLLFGQIPYGSQRADFPGERPPIYLRTFMGWCPRLATLELIGYTDWHADIAGRLLFPTSVFRSTAPTSHFEALSSIRHPNGNLLWLHQPLWTTIRHSFLSTLITIYNDYATRSGVLYISLLDLRDEICRQLRLSTVCFDQFLQHSIDELPTVDFPWSIAVETDIREQESSGAGQLRQPVYLRQVPHTLIALARLPQAR